jgi:peptide deformylase
MNEHPIITPISEKFPLLEMESQSCSIPISDADAMVIEQMNDLLNELGDNAAGLAAVQVGYPKRIFLLRINGENEAFINPIVVNKTGIRKRQEACLSLPGMAVTTRRPKRVTLKYFDIDGNIQERTFTGFQAQAVSHEMDHLNGTLVSHHLQEVYSNTVRRTKFGMKLTPHRLKVIKKRRAKKKRKK